MLTRARDIVVSLVGLLLTAPLIVLLMVGAAISTRGTPLFVQRRIGWHGRPFSMVKLRTMRDRVAPNGRPLPDRDRLVPFGRVLRASSLDELPELWHVLTGEMSLVGPRPLLPEYLPRYNDRQRRRHDVRPGITGWAQVNGRNDTSWGARLEMDVWYVEHRSQWLDLRILGRTLGQVLLCRGITPRGQTEMPPFLGRGDAPEHES